MNVGSSAARCFEIVECLAGSADELPLAEICRRVGLEKSAAHRSLALLIALGYAAQNEQNHCYRLTMKLPFLGFRHLAATGIHDVCEPVLNELARVSGEYVGLGIVEGDSLIWVANARGQRAALRYEPISGPVVRLHATASGAAWLATLPEAEALRILLKHGFDDTVEYGKNVAKTVPEVLRNIEFARANGFSVAMEWGEQGINVIAVAFAGSPAPNAPAAGTISIAGPAIRLPESRLLSFYPALKSAAEQIAAIWPLRAKGRMDAAVLEARAATARKKRA